MLYKIVWSNEALTQLDNIVKYLESRWSLNVIDDFLNLIKEYEDILARNPEAFPISKRNNKYRKCVITKQTSIYYKFEGKEVVIRLLWDNRQNPDNLNL
jgi:plasmid stabilization system protein ParE